jgi:acetyl-CoA carboxylase beta subunit/acetyl-CoA carboxylase alpha subunit
MNARAMLDILLDPGSFRGWDAPPADVRPDPGYAADLARARAAAGLDEAVITGEGLLAGRPVAVAAGEFAFLGGSVGAAAGERLAAAARRALDRRLPFVALPSSGGTRMQEGTAAFLQLVKITAAVTELKAAGLPYLVYLRHPVTGGVLATWASLGHVTLAEPGALIGFLGPRACQALAGRPVPPDVQRAEHLRDHGLIDAVVPPGALRPCLDRLLTALAPAAPPAAPPAPAPAAVPGAGPAPAPAWDSVLRTRDPGRPGAAALIGAAADDVVRLADGELVLALGRAGGRPCVLIGQDRGRPAGPAAFRLARRGMQLAAELAIPLVTVIDTPGAELSAAAEEHGIAGEIARCVAAMIALPVPTVAVLLGQGAGGAALALFPADRVIASGHAWLAPLAPEGASAIMYRDTAHAPGLAARQRIRAADLAAAGAVDLVVPEEPGFPAALGRAVRAELAALAGLGDQERMSRRLLRYRGPGG